jgi:hypothetical protein
MVNQTPAGRWFRRVTWVAIAANLVAALMLLAAPSTVIAMSGLPTAATDLWPRLAAMQILVLSLFYMPAGFDIDRYRAIAWLVVASHLAGALFFMLEPAYRLFGYYDFAFAVPLAVLLMLAVRGERIGSSVSVATL